MTKCAHVYTPPPTPRQPSRMTHRKDTIMHDYRKIAAIVGEEKINALREAGVEIGDKPTKPTTGLFGRWAKHSELGEVVCIWDKPDKDGDLFVYWREESEERGSRGDYVSVSELTFPEETTRPEDVEPGEAWLVRVDQGEYNVEPVYALKHSESQWITRKSRFCHEYVWPNSEVTLVAPLVPARPEPQSEHPRTLTSVEDYESVPAGTIVAKPNSSPCIKHFSGDWQRAKTWLTDSEMADTERQVLREGWGE